MPPSEKIGSYDYQIQEKNHNYSGLAIRTTLRRELTLQFSNDGTKFSEETKKFTYFGENISFQFRSKMLEKGNNFLTPQFMIA